ncbi:MAG TPA: 16S rRNA (guanine(527)-N(7))-methyltransferase RsmG [Candidatus Kapabacteria bacterium]|nr:16S rRNA (guanine(527)-N(7))-methyltransferase RsmG [Candidatus Kapabacteria bacterium]
MDLVKFWTISSSNSIVLTEEQIRQFERFESELRYWNEKVNLISRKDEDNIFERHFLHSLSILKYVDLKYKAHCLDFGTGGGFPGIPLKIARPDLNFLLVDSIKKKVKITDMFAKHTGLRNIKAISTRVEELVNERANQQKYDYIFARAVGKLELIIPWTYKLLKPDGTYIFLKGGDLAEEISQIKSKFPKINVNIIDIKMLGADFFESEAKKIVICKFNNN